MKKEKVEVGPDQTPEVPAVNVADPVSWSGAWDLVALAIPLLASFPWLRLEWNSLWTRQDRWFGTALIGLMLVAAITLRVRAGGSKHPPVEPGLVPRLSRGRSRAAVGLLLLGAVAALLAALWVAPWLGALAAITSLVAWALGRFPAVPASTILAWGGLLLLILPLPGRWEEQLPAWLEKTAGYLSGSFLDLVGIPNLRFANSLEVRELSFTFPLAGRGPFAFWGLAGLVGATLFLRRAPLLAALVSFAFLPVLGLALYLMRFVGLAYLQHAWGINALTDSSFFWLTLACLLVVYFGWLLLDLALRFLLDTAPPEVPELAPFYSRLNAVLCWPQEVPYDSPEEYLPPPEPVMSQPQEHWWRSAGLRAGALLAVGLSLFAGVVSLAVYGQSGLRLLNNGLSPEYTAEKLQDFPGREALPETVDGWQRTAFRSPLDEAAASDREVGGQQLDYVWKYFQGKRNLEFTLRLPFLGEPNPVSHFEQQGWEVSEIRVQRDSEGLETAWLELFLRNSSGGRAWVCISSFDSVGRPYSEWSELARLLPSRPDAFTILKRIVGEIPPLTMQFQLYCDAVDFNNKPELARLRRIYLQLRQKLLEDRTQRNWSLGT